MGTYNILIVMNSVIWRTQSKHLPPEEKMEAIRNCKNLEKKNIMKLYNEPDQA